MIEYQNFYAEMEITYDENKCYHSETYNGTWKECWEEAKSDGWTSFKNKWDEWQHRCPACNKPEKEELFEEIR